MRAHACLFSLWGNQSRSVSMKRAQMSAPCTGWRFCWKVLHLPFVALCPLFYLPHPVSLLRMAWPGEPIHLPNIHPCGWYHVYSLLWDRAVANCNQTSAKAISPPSLGSGNSSRGSRPGARDISLMFIWPHSPLLATSPPPPFSLPLSSFLSHSHSWFDAEIWFGERSRAYRFSLCRCLSLSLQLSPLSLLLSASFLSLSSVQS